MILNYRGVDWYCYEKDQLFDYDWCLQRRNTDLKCPCSTLQQGCWQVDRIISENKWAWEIPGPQTNWNFSGLYGGVYLAQNYKVPVAPNPQALYQKAVSWLETLKKDDGKED